MFLQPSGVTRVGLESFLEEVLTEDMSIGNFACLHHFQLLRFLHTSYCINLFFKVIIICYNVYVYICTYVHIYIYLLIIITILLLLFFCRSSWMSLPLCSYIHVSCQVLLYGTTLSFLMFGSYSFLPLFLLLPPCLTIAFLYWQIRRDLIHQFLHEAVKALGMDV